jgi:hypothetical protein
LTEATEVGNLHGVPDDAPSVAERVLVPAGPTLHEAARWVGHACWAELRWHEVLTGWMAAPGGGGVDGAERIGATNRADAPVLLWSLRADAGERAAMWHRRLPELSELPRHGFLACPSDEVASGFRELAATPTDAARLPATVAVLGAFLSGYTARQATAVGPADGPVARSLVDAVGSIERSRLALPSVTGARWSVSTLP